MVEKLKDNIFLFDRVLSKLRILTNIFVCMKKKL